MGISAALGSSALLPAGLGFRNTIINGAMVIDQRNSGASVTPSATAYTLDRWQFQCSVGSKMTVGQNLNSVTPPAGFTKYLGVQTGASANVTVGATDFYCINHYVEGFNSAQFGWGASTAKPVTLSFWVRSSIAGTHGVSFRNAGNNRSYPLSYTITSANTWEYKTLLVPGDVTGTWATDNTIGIFLSFNLGMGSTYSGTSGAWAGAVYAAPSGAVKVVETNSATFYLTGVQLEQNYQPTPFEQRPYGVELQLCQRYYWKWVSANNGDLYCSVYQPASTNFFILIPMPTVMRTRPSSATISGTWTVINSSASPVVYDRGSNWMMLNSTVNAGIGNTNQSGFFSNNASSTLTQEAEL